jgi:hypothetical protein
MVRAGRVLCLIASHGMARQLNSGNTAVCSDAAARCAFGQKLAPTTHVCVSLHPCNLAALALLTRVCLNQLWHMAQAGTSFCVLLDLQGVCGQVVCQQCRRGKVCILLRRPAAGRCSQVRQAQQCCKRLAAVQRQTCSSRLFASMLLQTARSATYAVRSSQSCQFTQGPQQALLS